jgi:SulP family sulfate permease
MLLVRASRPDVATLGRLPGDRDVYADLERNPGAERVPGMLLVRLDAPLYFFNASACRAAILSRLDDQPTPPASLVLDVGATTDLDVTTTDMLSQLCDDLAKRGTRLVLAQAKGRVRDRLARTGLLDRLGSSAVYFSVAQAVAMEQPRSPAPLLEG